MKLINKADQVSRKKRKKKEKRKSRNGEKKKEKKRESKILNEFRSKRTLNISKETKYIRKVR